MRAPRVDVYVEVRAFAAYCTALAGSGASAVIAAEEFDVYESHGGRRGSDEHCESGQDLHGKEEVWFRRCWRMNSFFSLVGLQRYLENSISLYIFPSQVLDLEPQGCCEIL